jgi:hypothetical protein
MLFLARSDGDGDGLSADVGLSVKNAQIPSLIVKIERYCLGPMSSVFSVLSQPKLSTHHVLVMWFPKDNIYFDSVSCPKLTAMLGHSFGRSRVLRFAQRLMSEHEVE